MAKKFIPDSDSEFAIMARSFANGIAKDPARYKISEEDSQMISRVVQEYRDALCTATAHGTRTVAAIGLKDEVRKKCEDVVREFGNFIRANRQISSADKIGVCVKERSKRLRPRTCPQTAPRLKFVSTTLPDGSPSGTHILRYHDGFGPGSRAKPDGAVRIELFADLVAPDEPVPEFPGQYPTGRPTYVRSFSKNPIEVPYPEPTTPMLLCYWARWADASGDVGPWSKTLITRVWGGPSPALPVSLGAPRTTIHRLDQARLALMLNRTTPLLENKNDQEQEMLPGPAICAERSAP